MKTLVRALLAILVSSALIGCSATGEVDPSPGLANVRVQVIGKPRDGAKQPIARVAVYDAAPQAMPVSGTYERVDYTNLDNVIVWLEPVNAPAKVTPSRKREVDIDPNRPRDDIAPASIGQHIVFRNNSSQPVNLYSVSEGNEFDLMSIAPGATGEFVAKSEGLIEILADPARPLIAQVYVAPSPWVTSAGSRRTGAFFDVPPGEYEIIAWHPRLPTSTQRVTLRANETSDATITVGVGAMSNDSQ
jgi:hypothetical protein